MASALAPSISRDLGESQELFASYIEDEFMVSPIKVEESSEDGDDVTDSELKDDLRASSADESEKNLSEPEELVKAEEKPTAESKTSSKSTTEKAKNVMKESRTKPKASTFIKNPDNFFGPLDSSVAEQVKCEGNRRERKQVERFSMPAPEKSKKGEDKGGITVVDGPGTKFADIPFIADQINKRRAVDLGNLHRLFFGRKGSPHEIKKNIRQFSGFLFDKNSAEYAKKKANVAKWELAALKIMCEVFGLLKKGSKEEIADRLLEFCVEPKDSGLEPKAKGKKSRTSSPGKRTKSRTSHKKKSSSQTSKKSKLSEGNDDEKDIDETPKSDDGNDNEKPKPTKKRKVEPLPSTSPSRSRSGPSRQASAGKIYKENEDEDEFNEIIVPTTKKTMTKPTNAKKEKGKEKPSNNRSPAKRKSPSSEPESSESPDDIDSEEERKKKESSKKPNEKKESAKKNPKFAPPVKKQKVNDNNDGSVQKVKVVKEPESSDSNSGDNDVKPEFNSERNTKMPSDDSLRKAVQRIVKNSDLRKVTMKRLLENVFDEYPNIDLEPKRTFIKSIVKDLLVLV